MAAIPIGESGPAEAPISYIYCYIPDKQSKYLSENTFSPGKVRTIVATKTYSFKPTDIERLVFSPNTTTWKVSASLPAHHEGVVIWSTLAPKPVKSQNVLQSIASHAITVTPKFTCRGTNGATHVVATVNQH